MVLQAASLFAGIGGFDLAAAQFGVETAIQAEIEPTAVNVLRARFPKAVQAGDARTVDLRGIDLVMAGFPCQGFSAAASTPKGRGIHDPKSKSFVIWAALQRVFAAHPYYLLMENADSLGTARYMEDLKALLDSLAEHGYHVHVHQLNAGCYGSNMRRTRTIILARRKPWPRPTTGSRVAWKCRDETIAIGVQNQHGGAVFCAQPSITLKAGSYSLLVTRDEVRSIRPEGVELLFGYPLGWTQAAGAATNRYERLGNTVSVYAAMAAFSMLFDGRAQTRASRRGYFDTIYPHTVPARGGTAGSAFGRILRTSGRSSTTAVGFRSPNTSNLELVYCVPVYERWMRKHPETVTEEMWDYLKQVKPTLPRPQPWPTTVEVEMEQRG